MSLLGVQKNACLRACLKKRNMYMKWNGAMAWAYQHFYIIPIKCESECECDFLHSLQQAIFGHPVTMII